MLSLAQKEFNLLIGNEWTPATGGATFETRDPATGATLGYVAAATPEDVDRAVDSAARSFDEGWGALEPYKRGRLLEKFAATLWERRDAIAEIETRDQGKTIREARADVAFAIQTLEYYAGLADKVHGDTIPVPGNRFNYTRREPIGVTAHIAPWNYPFQLAMRSLAPALAAGNTAILKPASLTPLSSLAMGEAAADAGLPAGTLNVLPGSGSVAGKALISHGDVRALAFTGSVDTGLEVGQAASARCVQATLELGGKCPNIVFADANLDAALKGAAFGAFLNAGQMCWAGSRLLVEREVSDDFIGKLAKFVETKMKLGPGMEQDTRMGPLVSLDHRKSVASYFGIAKDEGAKLVTGGGEPTDAALKKGAFLAPTIYRDVDPDGRLAQEEIFGPILSCFTFDTVDEAIDLANRTKFGLYAGVWTNDLGKAMRAANGIDAGQVSINEYPVTFPQSPFGGFKSSGVGHEQGRDAILQYTRLKTVFVNFGA